MTSRITPESIADHTDLHQSSTSWAGIERIVTTNDHAAFYQSALSAIIVPKRAFPAAAQFDDSFLLARQYSQGSIDAVYHEPAVFLPVV